MEKLCCVQYSICYSALRSFSSSTLSGTRPNMMVASFCVDPGHTDSRCSPAMNVAWHVTYMRHSPFMHPQTHTYTHLHLTSNKRHNSHNKQQQTRAGLESKGRQCVIKLGSDAIFFFWVQPTRSRINGNNSQLTLQRPVALCSLVFCSALGLFDSNGVGEHCPSKATHLY